MPVARVTPLVAQDLEVFRFEVIRKYYVRILLDSPVAWVSDGDPRLLALHGAVKTKQQRKNDGNRLHRKVERTASYPGRPC